MQIKISGHHVDISQTLNVKIKAALSILSERFDTLTSLSVSIKKDGRLHKVEITTSFEGRDITTKGIDEDMFSSIRSAKTKLIKSLESKKGQIKSARKRTTSSTQSLPAEIIQEMDLA